MVQLLLEQTEAGKLEWKPAAFDDRFQLSFRNYTLLLTQEPSDRSPEEMDYTIVLLNENGEVADRFSDVQLADEFGAEILDVNRRPYRVMRSLFDQARRRALGTDRILDAILDDLGDIPF
ncbi:hypothetical protein KQX64_23325 [Rhodopseudomonas palustris]|nr:hypothetical protein KQX64_23325 [Rhodopseudomonas palustris]